MTCELEVPKYVVSSGDRIVFLGASNTVRGFDFSKFDAVKAGDSVSSGAVTIVTTAKLTKGTESVSGNIVSVPMTGQAAGETWVYCIATLVSGAKEVILGRVIVVDPADPTTFPGCSS